MSRHPSGRRKQRHERTKRLLSVMLMFCLLLQGVNISALSVGASQETSCYIQEHTHSDSCYDEEGNLICGLDEHTHGDECYATDQSDESGEVIIDEETDSGDEATEAENDFADSESESTDSAEEVEDIDVVITTNMKYAVANEDKIIFNVEATGGKAPLNKYFEIYCNQDLAIGESLNGDTITYMPQSCGIYTLRVSVTDALGSTVGTEYTIPVAVNEKEDSSEWETALQDVTLTDDHAGNLADIAKTQIGYTESTRNFIINDNDEQKGYTRYGDWYGSAYEDWNTLFASFCLKYANVPDEYLVTAADSAAWMNEHPELYIDAEDGYTPKAGDLVFFHDSDDTENTDSNYPTRVGIIEAVDNENGKITAIEGDVQDSVTEQSYSLSDESIVGYVEIPSDAEDAETDEVEMSDADAEDMIAVASDTDADAGSDVAADDETERSKISLTSNNGKIENNGKVGFEVSVSDWNGNADEKDKLTGVVEKSVNGEWITVTNISSSEMKNCKFKSDDKTTYTIEELLNTPYRFRFTKNETTGETYIKEVMSEEFYLADLIQTGFRKWVLDVYPDIYNEGAKVETLTELATAYNIYKNNNVALNITAESEENLLGNVASFDISFTCSQDIDKNKSLKLYLNGDTGVDITNSAEAVLVSGSEYVSLGGVSNGTVTINLLDKLPKDTKIQLLYRFKVGEESKLGEHSVYGTVTNGDKATGEDAGKYKITEPTSGWMLRSAELQTTGDITPKRDDTSGTQVTYKLTLSNYGDSEVTAKKLEAEWSGGDLYSSLLNENNVIPAAKVTENADGTETRTPGTLELTCTFEAPASYESVENITFTVTDSIRNSKEAVSRLNLKQDGKYWLVTDDGTVKINVDASDNATFGTVSATVVDNLDETANADLKINGKIQYWDVDTNTWKTVTSNLTSPTSGVFSKVNTGSAFTATFNTTYLTVNDLLNTKYRFIANTANEKKITYSDDDNAADINASQPFYLVDKLEKSGFRNWVRDQANGYDTSSMTLGDLANAYKVYSRLGLNVDVSVTQKEYEAGFDATFNVNVSSESALNMNSEIRIKLSDITGVSSGDAINFQDNLSVVENATDYAQEITVEGDEIVVRMGKSLPTGKALCLKVTSALTFATEIGAHTISAHATYKEDGEIKLEDTDTGELNVVSPSGWHIVSVTGPTAAVYPGDEVAYTVKLRNFDDTDVTFTTNEIKALFGNDKSELKIVGYTDSAEAVLSDTFTLNGGETKEIIVKMTSPTGSEATGTKNVQFSVTDTAKKTETKDADMIFAKAEITIEPSVTYDSSTDKYTVKLVCKDLYGTEIPQHDLTWESKDTETTGADWTSIGTQNITATLGKDKKYTYVDNAEFVLTDDNLATLEAKKDSSVILYRLKDAVSGTDYYSLPVYFDNLQDLKDAAKLMVELAGKLGYSYDEFSKILDYLYYKEVAADDNVPFSDRSSLTVYLLKEYRDAGNDIDAAVKVWKKYYTDMMDPNMDKRSTNHGSSQALPTTKPQEYDWEDENLQYDKDEKGTASSPFHNVVSSVIKGMKELMQDGGLFKGSYFSDLSKTAKADEDGDENKERNYTIDIKANADGTVSVPTVVVFQIQTSWQMFDLQHANQVNGPKGASCTVTDMATLYDIKHAMIDFAEYMKEHGDGSVCFAVTDVEHAGTFSMISSPYFTNDMDTLIKGLEQWDIFGNCEHVHYTSQAYEDAVAALSSSTFSQWKDGNGNSIYEKANKVAVVIGGSTENSSGKDGYGCVLPDMTGLNCLYTIRCNSGTASPYLSWLDNTAMTNLVKKYNGIAFKDVTSRDQLVSVFKAILQDIGKLGKIDAAKNVVLEDTVENEFTLLEDTIKLVTYDFNGNATETDIDQSKIEITKNDNGTTTIKYSAGEVAYGETVHLKFKVHAKDSYIGSNNVKTNVDVPTLQYQNDIYGSGIAQMKFTDEPKVNVPVTYTIEDGGTKEVQVDTEVNLWNDLDAEKIIGMTGDKTGIEDWASGSGDNYDQINGTVTYQWEKQKLDDSGNLVTDDNGNPVYETFGDPASVHVTNGKADEDYPDLETKFTPTTAGDYKFRLKTVFTPDNKTDDWSGENDSQVSESVQYGYVTVTAKEQVKTASIKVIKNIDNYSKMSDGFNTTKFTVSVAKADGSSVVTKPLTSQEYDSSDSNTAQGTVSIDGDTKLVFSELTQDDRALKFEFKALNITITDKDGKETKTSYSADNYSLNGDGKLVDENGEVVQIAVNADDSVEAEFVNSFIASPIPTGILAGSYMKWLIAAIAVIAVLGVSRYSFVIRKRRRGGR